MEATVAKAQNPLQRIVFVAFGWILTFVGILGLFIPIVPGVFLIVAGALMLLPPSEWLQRAEKYRARFPVLDRAFTRFSAWGDSRQSLSGSDPDNSGSRSTV